MKALNMWIIAAPTMRLALHEWMERMSQPNETCVMMKCTLS